MYLSLSSFNVIYKLMGCAILEKLGIIKCVTWPWIAFDCFLPDRGFNITMDFLKC